MRDLSSVCSNCRPSCAAAHRDTPKDVMKSLSPMGRPSTIKDSTDAVLYLTDAATVAGHVLYVDGGAHFGRWQLNGISS